MLLYGGAIMLYLNNLHWLEEQSRRAKRNRPRRDTKCGRYGEVGKAWTAAGKNLDTVSNSGRLIDGRVLSTLPQIGVAEMTTCSHR